jgi:D-alanyl-D-alanine carboxypeptidase
MTLIRRVHFLFMLSVTLALASAAVAGQFAAYVMDARTGQTLYAENADTRLNPASLTKMMTLYITFQEIEAGRISLDTMITVSKNAASQPPSRLGLKAGQKIALRYLIRAAAVKSANDAAAAIGDALAGSPEKWGARMTKTARQLGMKNSTFRNANGLTAKGHLSTARDMTILGRHLFYDFPQYYNLFSRRTTDAGIATVANTNHSFLDSYKGADGIKTGYTDAAGFNLTASAERNGVRLIGTIFGATSTAQRTQKMSAMFDAAFKKAPKEAPTQPLLMAAADPENTANLVATQTDDEDGTVDTALPEVAGGAGKTIRLQLAVASSPTPRARPTAAETATAPKVASMQDGIAAALAEATGAPVTAAPPDTLQAQAQNLSGEVDPDLPEIPAPEVLTVKASTPVQKVELAAMAAPPPQRQAPIYDDSSASAAMTEATDTSGTDAAPAREEVVRVSTSGGGNWGVTLGTMNTRSQAERLLLQIQLSENATLGESLRKVVPRGGGYEADFFGLSQEQADLACRRLQARGQQCFTIGPS